MGHSQGRAVLLMYAWTGLVAGTAVAVAFVPWPADRVSRAPWPALLIIPT